MSMTKKDYVMVAGVLNILAWAKNTDPATMAAVTWNLADAFAQANNKFRKDQFIGLVWGCDAASQEQEKS